MADRTLKVEMKQVIIDGKNMYPGKVLVQFGYDDGKPFPRDAVRIVESVVGGHRVGCNYDKHWFEVLIKSVDNELAPALRKLAEGMELDAPHDPRPSETFITDPPAIAIVAQARDLITKEV